MKKIRALWALGFVACCCLLLYAAYSNYLQSQRRAAIWSSCAVGVKLHVLVEAELGAPRQAARATALLLDSAECPNQVRVHLLEPVSSIKAFDDMTPALQSEGKIAPRYGTYFQEQIGLQKVHQSRDLRGLRAVLHLLDGMDDEAWVVWWPAGLEAVKGWDKSLLHDLAGCTQTSILSCPAIATDSVFSMPAKPAFFTIDSSLHLKPQALARPALCASLGISLLYPLIAQAATMKQLAIAGVDAGLEDEELALSLIAYKQGLQAMHCSSALYATPPKQRLPNRRHQAFVLGRLTPEEEWLWHVALGFDEDFVVYARAMLGISPETPLAEVMAKYGSKEALETEKEALKYG